MINRYFLLCFLTILTTSANSQPKNSAADSLARLIASSVKEDSNKVKLLLEYNRYVAMADLDSSLKISRQALGISNKINYGAGVARSLANVASYYLYKNMPDIAIVNFQAARARTIKDKNKDLEALICNKIGNYYGMLGITDSAARYFSLSVDISKNLPNKTRYASAIGDLGSVYYTKGEFVEALRCILEAKNIFQANHSLKELFLVYNRLGLIYYELHDFNRSVGAFRMALRVNDSVHNPQYDRIVTLNLGELYSQVKKDYDSARIFLNKALKLAKETKDEEILLMSLSNLGSIASILKNYEQALYYYQKADSLPAMQTRNRERTGNYLNMGAAYYFLGDLPSAEKYAKQAFEMATRQKFGVCEKNASKLLGDISAKKKNYKDAYEYYVNYTSLQDTMLADEVKQKVVEAVFQNTLQQKDNENLILQKENEVKQQTISNQRIYILAAILILLLGTLLLVVTIRNGRKQKSLNQILDQKNMELKELNLAKDKFFSIIAHDLRSPFNSFLGLTNIMSTEIRSLSPSMAGKMARLMNESATNLFNLLENLLEWSRSQQSLTRFNPEPIELMTETTTILKPVFDMSSGKGVEICIQIPEKISVLADANMLASIIRNLTSNAVKYTRKGGKVTISAMPAADGFVEISVMDTGIGMSRAKVEDLFRLDVKSNTRGTNNESSTGLGLIICNEFVEKHGGKIRIESEEEKGSTFYFTVPSSNIQEEKNVTGDALLSPDQKTVHENLKILIVEDDETSDFLLSRMVKKNSRETLHAKTGFEAIDISRKNPDIDLILMDLSMPGMNGFDATKKIREFNQDVIIIAQTADYIAGNGEPEAIAAGCNDFLAKPIMESELRQKILKYF